MAHAEAAEAIATKAIADAVWEGLDQYQDLAKTEGYDLEAIFAMNEIDLKDFCDNELKMKKGHVLKFKNRMAEYKEKWKLLRSNKTNRIKTIALSPLPPETLALAQPNWYGPDDLDKVGLLPTVSDIQEGKFGCLDIHQTMDQLGNCGQCLRLALMAAGDHDVSVMILKLTQDYHTATSDALGASRKMVFTAVQSLHLHKDSLAAFADSRFEDGQVIFEHVSQLAVKMSEEASKLEKQAGQLESDSAMACVSAREQAIENSKDKDKLIADRCRLEEDQAKAKEEKERSQAVADQAAAEKSQKQKDIEAEITRVENELNNIKLEDEEQLKKIHEEVAKVDQEGAKKLAEENNKIKDAKEKAAALREAAEAENDTAWLADVGRGALRFVTGGAAGSGQRALIQKKNREANNAAKEAAELVQQREEAVQGLAASSQAARQAVLDRLAKSQEQLQDLRRRKFIGQQEQLQMARQEVLKKEQEMADCVRKVKECNKDMGVLLHQLNSNVGKASAVENSVTALNICVKALGKVKVAFGQQKGFWQQVAQNAEALSSNKIRAQESQLSALEAQRDTIANSFSHWAAMGLLNHHANKLLQNVKQAADEVMEDLPVGETALDEIKRESAKLMGKVKAEDDRLQIPDSTVQIDELGEGEENDAS